MAEGAISVYNDFKEQLGNGVHDLINDDIRITLHTGYTPDLDAHAVFADVAATEYPTGAGYTQGGVALASKTITQDNVNDRALWDAADALFASIGPLSPVTPSHAIIWNNTPTVPADPLIAVMELGTTPTNGGDYTIQFSSSPAAIITLT